jgi:hypothetical protein
MLSNTVKTRGLHLGLRFAPQISLDKQKRQEFLGRVSEGFDWTRHDYADKVWRLASPQSEGDPRSHLKLTVQADSVNFEDFFPIAPYDVFLDNLRLTMAGFHDVFAPKIVLASTAVIRFTAEVDGNDARVFLGNKCLNLDNRLKPLGRPIHAVGLKLLLPPVAANDEPPWQAEVKIESLVEDIRQVFVELDAKWGTPSPWNVDELIRRVNVANDFARKQVVAFLAQYESDGA